MRPSALRRLAVVIGLGAAVLTAATLSAKSETWSIEAMNKAIDQTNFIVDKGCSGTLVGLHPPLVLTNFHCIDNHVTSVDRELTNSEGYVKKVKVRVYKDVPVQQNIYAGFTRTGAASYVSEIVAESKTRDLALLRLKGSIPHIYFSPLAPDHVAINRGDPIYSVGNPAGEDATLGFGIVSNVNRSFDFPWTDGARLPMIQFSGGLFGGNSGGALYNDRGQLIGVPAAGYRDATFIGFAVPVSVVKEFLRDHCFDAGVSVDAACLAAKAKKAEKNRDE